MRILVDAMGGDNAPDQIALGAIQAAKDFNCEVVLVGRGEAILRALKDQGIETLPKGVEIANADDVVDMHDDPATVVKKKKDSSMVVGLNMLKEGGGDAFVSAGSTGALLSAATLTVRRVKGIRRAAMAPVVPTGKGGAVLIDCGATADSDEDRQRGRAHRLRCNGRLHAGIPAAICIHGFLLRRKGAGH